MNPVRHIYQKKILPSIKNWAVIQIILGVIDIFMIALAFQCSYLINYSKFGGRYFFENLQLLKLFIAIMPVWLIILYLLKIAEIPRAKRYWALFLEYFQSTIFIFLLLFILYFVFKLYEVSRLFMGELIILGFIFLLIVRILEYRIFKVFRSKGYNLLNIAIIADDTSVWFVEKLIANKEWGYKVVAIFTDSKQFKEYEETIIMLPEEYLKVVNDLMEENVIDEVLYLKNKVKATEVREIIRSCEELGVTFGLRYNDPALNITNAVKTTIGDEKFFSFINIPSNTFALGIKKLLDIIISLIMIIILSPFMLLIGILIKFTSKGPAIFKQERIGLRGRKFSLYKFRTMVMDAEKMRDELSHNNEADGPAFKIKDDPRVTKIGKFLRQTGLDELPQLFNILKGEMSLIGPRPPLESEVREYKRWQLRRLSVRPGLSCFWQIMPERNTIKFEKWMEMDLAYIDNWSLRLDFMIFLRTILTILKRTGL
jgi:exopolysaccharide biosynthesis polyprenyl glycosylphosphotransferase